MTKPNDHDDGVFVWTSPQRFTVLTPFGRLDIDEAGLHLTHQNGTSFDLGSVPVPKVNDGR